MQRRGSVRFAAPWLWESVGSRIRGSMIGIARNAPATLAWIGSRRISSSVSLALPGRRHGGLPAYPLLPLLNFAVAVCVLGYWRTLVRLRGARLSRGTRATRSCRCMPPPSQSRPGSPLPGLRMAGVTTGFVGRVCHRRTRVSRRGALSHVRAFRPPCSDSVPTMLYSRVGPPTSTLHAERSATRAVRLRD